MAIRVVVVVGVVTVEAAAASERSPQSLHFAVDNPHQSHYHLTPPPMRIPFLSSYLDSLRARSPLLDKGIAEHEASKASTPPAAPAPASDEWAYWGAASVEHQDGTSAGGAAVYVNHGLKRAEMRRVGTVSLNYDALTRSNQVINAERIPSTF